MDFTMSLTKQVQRLKFQSMKDRGVENTYDHFLIQALSERYIESLIVVILKTGNFTPASTI